MLIQHISILNTTQKQTLFDIWNAEYPEKLAYQNIAAFEEYLSKLNSATHFLLYDDSQEIKGWACTFDRESERWFLIILNSDIHGKGYGKQLLKVLKEHETHLSGWVIDHHHDKKSNKEYYRSPLDFYTKCGFLVTDTKLKTEKISAVKIVWDKS
ncbi:MAG: GNAT family N-acetyltransferase [Raineya sp.]|jgi:GNAT superfamily N-acetyltransferase|nr:GNAT family N-acetyltransferase [Raineya sp.]